MTTTTNLAEMREGLIAFRNHTRASVLRSEEDLERELLDLAGILARRREAARQRGVSGDTAGRYAGRVGGGLLIAEVDEIVRLFTRLSTADLARNARDYAVAAGQVEVLPEPPAEEG
jgi:hypothetical protein